MSMYKMMSNRRPDGGVPDPYFDHEVDASVLDGLMKSLKTGVEQRREREQDYELQADNLRTIHSAGRLQKSTRAMIRRSDDDWAKESGVADVLGASVLVSGAPKTELWRRNPRPIRDVSMINWPELPNWIKPRGSWDESTVGGSQDQTMYMGKIAGVTLENGGSVVVYPAFRLGAAREWPKSLWFNAVDMAEMTGQTDDYMQVYPSYPVRASGLVDCAGVDPAQVVQPLPDFLKDHINLAYKPR